MMITTSAYDYLRSRVHSRLAATGDPLTEASDVRKLIEAEVEAFQHAAMRRQNDFEPLADPGLTVERLVQDVSGMGNELAELPPGLHEVIIVDGNSATGPQTARCTNWPTPPTLRRSYRFARSSWPKLMNSSTPLIPERMPCVSSSTATPGAAKPGCQHLSPPGSTGSSASRCAYRKSATRPYATWSSSVR